MAAASHAIAERLPLVDVVLEVRDARIPLSTEYNQLGDFLSSSRVIIVLNKIDLAKQLDMKEWIKYFDQQKSLSFGDNAHNKENIREIASHPNIYVLDTLGILSPEILDHELCSKLALTGAISDCIVGKTELARYFLAVLNLSQEYNKWSKFSSMENDRSSIYHEGELSENSHMDKRQKRQSATDHTQHLIVNDLRRILFDAVSSFSGNLEDDKYLKHLSEVQFRMLQSAFRITTQSNEDGHSKVAIY